MNAEDPEARDQFARTENLLRSVKPFGMRFLERLPTMIGGDGTGTETPPPIELTGTRAMTSITNQVQQTAIRIDDRPKDHLDCWQPQRPSRARCERRPSMFGRSTDNLGSILHLRYSYYQSKVELHCNRSRRRYRGLPRSNRGMVAVEADGVVESLDCRRPSRSRVCST
jgi:hypothetical protein